MLTSGVVWFTLSKKAGKQPNGSNEKLHVRLLPSLCTALRHAFCRNCGSKRLSLDLFTLHAVIFDVWGVCATVCACVMGFAYLYHMSTMLRAAQMWHLPVLFAPWCSSNCNYCVKQPSFGMCAQKANMQTAGYVVFWRLTEEPVKVLLWLPAVTPCFTETSPTLWHEPRIATMPLCCCIYTTEELSLPPDGPVRRDADARRRLPPLQPAQEQHVRRGHRAGERPKHAPTARIAPKPSERRFVASAGRRGGRGVRALCARGHCRPTVHRGHLHSTACVICRSVFMMQQQRNNLPMVAMCCRGGCCSEPREHAPGSAG